MKLPKILLPTIVGVTVYIIVDRLFPEEVEKDPFKDLRGGGGKANLVKEIVKKILKDKFYLSLLQLEFGIFNLK